MKRIVIFLLTCALGTSAYAGAWVQPEGEGLFVADATYFSSGHYYNSNSDLTQQPKYRKYEFQPYVEYGLLDNLTVGASAGFQHDLQSGTDNNGMADPEIFLRSVIWKDATRVVSLQPLVKFSSGFEYDAPPRGGSYSTDVELSLLYGQNINIFSTHDFIDLRGGYRYRANALNDQIKLDALIGLEVAPHWVLTPALRSTTSTGIKDSAAFSENGDQDYNLTKLEVGLAYQVTEKQTVALTVADHIWGTQTGNGVGVTLGFAQRF